MERVCPRREHQKPMERATKAHVESIKSLWREQQKPTQRASKAHGECENDKKQSSRNKNPIIQLPTLLQPIQYRNRKGNIEPEPQGSPNKPATNSQSLNHILPSTIITSYHHTIKKWSLPKANRYQSTGVDTDKPEPLQQSIINKYKVQTQVIAAPSSINNQINGISMGCFVVP